MNLRLIPKSKRAVFLCFSCRFFFVSTELHSELLYLCICAAVSEYLGVREIQRWLGAEKSRQKIQRIHEIFSIFLYRNRMLCFHREDTTAAAQSEWKRLVESTKNNRNEVPRAQPTSLKFLQHLFWKSPFAFRFSARFWFGTHLYSLRVNRLLTLSLSRRSRRAEWWKGNRYFFGEILLSILNVKHNLYKIVS